MTDAAPTTSPEPEAKPRRKPGPKPKAAAPAPAVEQAPPPPPSRQEAEAHLKAFAACAEFLKATLPDVARQSFNAEMNHRYHRLLLLAK